MPTQAELEAKRKKLAELDQILVRAQEESAESEEAWKAWEAQKAATAREIAEIRAKAQLAEKQSKAQKLYGLAMKKHVEDTDSNVLEVIFLFAVAANLGHIGAAQQLAGILEEDTLDDLEGISSQDITNFINLGVVPAFFDEQDLHALLQLVPVAGAATPAAAAAGPALAAPAPDIAVQDATPHEASSHLAVSQPLGQGYVLAGAAAPVGGDHPGDCG